MLTDQPVWLSSVCERVKTQCDQAWDSFVVGEQAWDTPMGELVASFLKHGGPKAELQLIWLMMFATRRVLPCWQIYCDTSEPIETVNVIRNWLIAPQPQDWSKFITPAEPAYQGVPIVDCRQCDTSAVASAAAKAAEFIKHRNPLAVIESLGDADAAIDQSPLQAGNHYREWFINVAIPTAYLLRDLTTDEQSAFLDYNIDEVLKNSSKGET
ncbi:hypothetical protein [Gimesia maris]|uniref:hypothetical protein n=1 Tax=Gimesia maris TaxID=122 RepID=UPI003A8E0DA4